MRRLLLILVILIAGCNQYGGDKSSVRDETTKTQTASGIIYSNPRVYNIECSFEMSPDPNKIDQSKDMKLWLPIPREWESQKAVKIISVQPEPHGRYVDPEYGNPMLFWDFGKEPEQSSYKVDIKFRLESYDISVKVDPERVGSYDKSTKEYALYTRSTHTIYITPKIREMAHKAIGDEKNPYLQAKRIVESVRKKVRFKVLDFERGRGIKCLLDYPVIDKKTGEEYYEGACNQYSALFIALCRAVGIPAKSVQGFIGWNPWVNEEDLKPRYEFETKLSPTGLSGAQDFGVLGRHTWAEFYIPSYGWIPADPQGGMRRFANLPNKRVILCKGRDIMIGPDAPQKESQGYGAHWIPLHDGRADSFHRAVWNIAKIHTAKIKTLQYSDPFPADGLASYNENLHSAVTQSIYEDVTRWRQGVLNWPSCNIRNLIPENLNLNQFYKDHPRAIDDREAFVCHMLRRQLGDEKFFKLADTYMDLRQKSNQPVSTSRFQELAEDIYGEPLDWFFNEWVNSTELPRLKLEKVSARKDKKGWQVQGRLLQLGDTTFRLPIELALDTEKGREKQKLWIEKKRTDFEFRTLHEPRKLVVDPDYEILKVQKMAPRLWWFWDMYPKIIIVYGTLGETEANKIAAERFNNDYLGLGSKVVKADTDINDTDLKTEFVFLIGRPETNKITQKFKDIFPIKIDKNTFTWRGTTYAQPTQAIAQIVENPGGTHNLMIMHAGLSPEATQEFPCSYLGRADRSYVIFDGDKQLFRGDWEDADSNLYWNFKMEPSVQLKSNQR